MMPNYIQPREYSRGGGVDGIPRVSDGNPNLLGVNRNDDGRWLNAYWDNPENRWNRESGFAFVVSQISSFLSNPYLVVGEFCFSSCPFQPPSILPASTSGSDNAIYFFVSMPLISQSKYRRNLRVSREIMALRTNGCFSCFCKKLAIKIFSII